jgi:hypothetical protein
VEQKNEPPEGSSPHVKRASDHRFDAMISDVFDVEFIPPESVRHLASPMVALAGVSVLVF